MYRFLRHLSTLWDDFVSLPCYQLALISAVIAVAACLISTFT